MTKNFNVVKKRVAKRILSVMLVLIIVGVFSGGFLLGVNRLTVKNVIEFAESFDSVDFSEERLVPYVDSDGYWTYDSDNGIKIMQITDLHLRGSIFQSKLDKAALNAVAAMVHQEKPDLLIATGDIVQTTFSSAGSIDNLGAFKLFSSLMEKLGVYWTFTFGNHDTETGTYFSRQDFCDYLEDTQLSFCLFERGPEDIFGYGNSVIKVKNSLGIITQSIFTMDSNDYVRPFGDYDHIHQDQIEWYKETVSALQVQNFDAIEGSSGGSSSPEIYLQAPSLLFIHIPLKEYDDAWEEYADNFLIDTENVEYIYGNKLEEVCYAPGDDEMFEAILEKGSTKGIFCGHEHSNDFSLKYKGITLTYSKSIKYNSIRLSFNKGYQRGCTIIQTEDSGEWRSYTESFYQDKYITQYPKDEADLEI